LPLALGLLFVVLAVVGVATDLTRMFLARRSLQSVADAASLRAAVQLDEASLYGSSGSVIRIAPEAARAAAMEVIALRGLDARPSVAVEDELVTVTLRSGTATMLLRLVGIERLPVAVTSTSVPVEGAP